MKTDLRDLNIRKIGVLRALQLGDLLNVVPALRPELVKPNYDEAVKLLRLPHQQSARANQLNKYSTALHHQLHAGIIALTLDAEGSMIIENGNVVHHCDAVQVPGAHVSGAGDTYLSAYLLAYLSSFDVCLSADIATAAATIAIEKKSTSICSQHELTHFFTQRNKLVAGKEQLQLLCDSLRRNGKRIVFTNGCFDILHSGHVSYLQCVKKEGDVLIVGVNNDESIKRLKGESRPINQLSDRLQVLAGLGSVDYVVPFGSEADDTPIPLIPIIRPAVFAKGGDYTKDRLPEATIVEACGGEIIFIPYLAERSTTNVIRRIGERYEPVSRII